jgi:hypothetical protein
VGAPIFAVLLIGALLFSILAARPRFAPLEAGAGWALTLLPAILMTVVIQMSGGTLIGESRRDTNITWRVTLSGFRFLLPADRELYFGDDPHLAHLVISGLPPKTSMTIRTDLAEGTNGDLLLTDSVPTARGGAISVIRSEKNVLGRDVDSGIDPIFGGIHIPAGSQICLSDDGAQCRRDSARLSWERHGDTALLRDASGVTLCLLPPPIKARATSTAAKRIFPLATYGRTGCMGNSLFSWDESSPAGEFLYWSEREPTWKDRIRFWKEQSAELYLRPVDYGHLLVVVSPGQTRRVDHMPLHVSAGKEAHLSLYEIIPAYALPTSKRGDDNFAKLQERRSFLLRYSLTSGSPRAALDVFLDSPQAVTIATPQTPTISISSQAASPATLARSKEIAGFSLIGSPTAAALLNTVRRHVNSEEGTSNCGGQKELFFVQGITAVTCAQIGRWFAIGDPTEVLAKVRIAPIIVPTAWVAAIWALALINLLVRDLLKLGPDARVLLGLLEVLLVFRVLIAFEVSVFDPRREDTVASAWIALVWLPLAFELAPRSIAGLVESWIARVGKTLLVLAATSVIARASGVAIDTQSGWNTWAHSEIGKSAFVCWGLLLAAGLVSYHSSLLAVGPKEPTSHHRALARAAIPLIVLFLGHLALLAVGVKEQIGGMRITAVLVPLLVVAWANWYAVVRRMRVHLSGSSEMIALFAPFLAYGAFILTRDIGAFIYFIGLAIWLGVGAWPRTRLDWAQWGTLGALVGFGLMIAMCGLGSPFKPLLVPGIVGVALALIGAAMMIATRRSSELRPRIASLPALAVSAILGGVLAGGWIIQRAMIDEPLRHTATWDDIAHIESLSGNSIRLLDLLAPEAVENLGVRSAYEQRVAMAEMFDYGATLGGAGWLHIARPNALRQTQADDNVTAVHVLGPFGREGGLGIGIFLLAFAVTVYVRATSRPPPAAIRAELGATMLVAASLYMLLANVGLVPFTGRNFYLLAVASHSDLVEGGFLLVIILSSFRSDLGVQRDGTAA